MITLDLNTAIEEIPILVVDDVQDNLDLMEALLIGEGFESVHLLSKSTEVFDFLEQNPDVGLILLDLMMPDIDGYEVCRNVAKNPNTAHIPILIVTGAAFKHNDALVKSFAAGAIDFLSKPLNEVELFARVKVALSLYKERVLHRNSLTTILKNEENFRTIIDQAPVGIAKIDKNNNLLVANCALCEILGCQEDIKGKNLFALCEQTSFVESLKNLLHHNIKDKRATELHIQLPEQKQLSWLYISATPVKEEGVITDNVILIIENITERKEQTEKITKMAYYDTLTQLPNRALFYETIEKVIYQLQDKKEAYFAVLFLDLDNFKNINDSLGHLIGDKLLQGLAKRIQDSLRKNDLIARLGGDEFALLIDNINTINDSKIVAEKILKHLEKPIEIDNEHSFYVGVSIGISIYPQDGTSVESLIKNADTAMYRAKELGKRTYQLFNSKFDNNVQTRLDLEQELRHSISESNFVLYYQPQLNIKTKKIVGVESLIRWNHPRRGFLNPGAFLPFAEETGLIIQLDKWVIEQACLQAKQWYDMGYTELTTYINFSLLQFQQVDFISHLQNTLDKVKLPPALLGIEITENISSLDNNIVVDVLKSLKNLGIKVVLDDFGIGYSSLSHLATFPLHGLKIDKVFVQKAPENKSDESIVETITNLGHSFGLEIVAEGIESQELLDFIGTKNCDIAQGYFISKPVKAEEVTKLFTVLNI